MRCLFCKDESGDSRSKEHIVPESLGNIENTLPIGYVCDKCNNYLARKVEKPFFDLYEIKALRFQEDIPNKSGRFQVIDGLLDGMHQIKMHREFVDGNYVFSISCDDDQIVRALLEKTEPTIILPAFVDQSQFVNSIIVSRFIAKIALEALAQRLKSPEGQEYLVQHEGLDLLRNHARNGTTPNWPCHIRRIYSIREKFKTNSGVEYRMLHEYDFLLLSADDIASCIYDEIPVYIYFVFALFGLEFVINMAEPEIEGYKSWLKEHDNISPLYYGKNSTLSNED